MDREDDTVFSFRGAGDGDRLRNLCKKEPFRWSSGFVVSAGSLAISFSNGTVGIPTLAFDDVSCRLGAGEADRVRILDLNENEFVLLTGSAACCSARSLPVSTWLSFPPFSSPFVEAPATSVLGAGDADLFRVFFLNENEEISLDCFPVLLLFSFVSPTPPSSFRWGEREDRSLVLGRDRNEKAEGGLGRSSVF
jgi:hypothetical protein